MLQARKHIQLNTTGGRFFPHKGAVSYISTGEHVFLTLWDSSENTYSKD